MKRFLVLILDNNLIKTQFVTRVIIYISLYSSMNYFMRVIRCYVRKIIYEIMFIDVLLH